MPDYRCTTELEAVNYALLYVKQLPANDLNSADPTVSQCRDLLQKYSREIQSVDWGFNSEENYPLPADVNGIVYIPTNALVVIPDDKSLVVRGNKLFDRENHTYKIGRTVTATVRWFLPFEQLPQPVRNYLTIKTARQYATLTRCSQTLFVLTQQDEDQAFWEINSYEIETTEPNFGDNPTVRAITGR